MPPKDHPIPPGTPSDAERFSRLVGVLASIARTIGSKGDLDASLNEVLALLTEKLFDAAALYLVEGDELVLYCWRNLPASLVRREAVLHIGEFSAGECARRRAFRALSPPDADPTERTGLREGGFALRVNVPVVFHSRTIGVLSLFSRRPLDMPPDVEVTLGAVANQIGLGIENYRMVVKLQREAGVLQTQRDFTQALIDAMGDGVLALDTSGRIEFYNRRFYSLTRFSADELTGKEWRAFVAAGASAFSNVMRESLEKGEPVFCECRWKRNDGGSFPGFTGVCPRLGADGGPAGFVVSIADLTERRHLEDLLRRQNRELTFINEASAVLAQSVEMSEVGPEVLDILAERFQADFGLIYLHGMEGRLEACASVGLSDAELIAVEFVGEDGGIAWRCFREERVLQHYGRGPDGSVESLRRNRRILAVPLPASGVCCGVLVLARKGRKKFSPAELRALNIVAPQIGAAFTNLKLVERMKREAAKTASLVEITSALLGSSERREFTSLALQRTLEALALDFGAVFDLQGECGLLACAPAPAPPWTEACSSLLPRLLDLFEREEFAWIEDVSSHPAGELSSLLASAGARSCAVVPVTVDGARTALLLLMQQQFARRWTGEDKEFIRAVADQLGVAYRNAELYRKLSEANVELRTLDEMKSNLLANVSHELRTPLVSIRGYIEMTLEGMLGEVSEKQKKGLQIALRNVDRLVGLIENLLNFARLERGSEKLELSRFPLDDLVFSVARQFEPIFRSREIALDIEAQAGIALHADYGKLSQVLANLFDNAAKFAPRDGRVLLRAYRDESSDRVIIEVHDSGPGIPPAERDRVFDRFYQVDSASTRKHGGTGIGLAICRDIIRMHGGEISVERSGLGGAMFRLVIPSPAVVAEGAEEVRSGEQPPPLVLLSTLYPEQADMFERALRKTVNVMRAPSHGAAVEAALRYNPDVVLADLFLPEDGFFRLVHDVRNRGGGSVSFIASAVFPIARNRFYYAETFRSSPPAPDALDILLADAGEDGAVLIVNGDEETEEMLHALCANRGLPLSFADGEATEIPPPPGGRYSLVLFDVSRAHRKVLSLLAAFLARSAPPLPRIVVLSREAHPMDREEVRLLKGDSASKPLTAARVRKLALSAVAPPAAPRDTGRVERREGPRRVLVIDDEPEILQLIKLILEPSGWDVITMSSGMGAAEAVFRTSPDLVLLDIAMPGLDGFDVLARLSKSPDTARVPVIILSARTDQATIRRALAAGAAHFIQKPFRNADLLKIIERTLS